MTKQLALVVHVRVKPEDAQKLVEAHRPVWAGCAGEPECLLFDVFQDPEDKGRFRFIEVWSKSKEWFDSVQFQRSYYDRVWKLSKPLWLEECERSLLTGKGFEQFSQRTIMLISRTVKIEYMERFGEGSIYRQGYLDGGQKMD